MLLSCLLASAATSHSLTSLLKNRLLRIFIYLLSEMADEVSVVSCVSISFGCLFWPGVVMGLFKNVLIHSYVNTPMCCTWIDSRCVAFRFSNRHRGRTPLLYDIAIGCLLPSWHDSVTSSGSIVLQGRPRLDGG